MMRGSRVAWLAIAIAILFAALDVATVFGSFVGSTKPSRIVNGFDYALQGGCLWVRTGAGFMRDGKVGWEKPLPRRWWPTTNWYSISGMLNWRETIVPLWSVWGSSLAIAAITGPIARWRRRNRGQCVLCGYSREGLGADAPCPECGERHAIDTLLT